MANSWRKRTRKDGIVDWIMITVARLNIVKELTKLYQGAESEHKGQLINIWEAAKYEC